MRIALTGNTLKDYTNFSYWKHFKGIYKLLLLETLKRNIQIALTGNTLKEYTNCSTGNTLKEYTNCSTGNTSKEYTNCSTGNTLKEYTNCSYWKHFKGKYKLFLLETL